VGALSLQHSVCRKHAHVFSGVRVYIQKDDSLQHSVCGKHAHVFSGVRVYIRAALLQLTCIMRAADCSGGKKHVFGVCLWCIVRHLFGIQQGFGKQTCAEQHASKQRALQHETRCV
jgi:hypothetical protein